MPNRFTGKMSADAGFERPVSAIDANPSFRNHNRRGLETDRSPSAPNAAPATPKTEPTRAKSCGRFDIRSRRSERHRRDDHLQNSTGNRRLLVSAGFPPGKAPRCNWMRM
jgi:hypothetical protein